MDLMTITNVELCSVGMAWPSAGGPVTLTFEHLSDAVRAGNDDPHIVPARIKIGHTDPRFADPEDPGHDPFYDGEPSFGQVQNLWLANDGAILMGDYVNVPAWLAEGMPAFYPNRSIEGASINGLWDVETPGGKKYSFVLTAVALLGVTRPACADLEDLAALLETGEGVIFAQDDAGVAASATLHPVKPTPELGAAVEKVIDVFMDAFATEESGRYWWWPRSVWTDPNQIIADDDEGGLWRVPFTSSDTQDVTFGDPVRVLQTFQDAPAPAAASAARLAASTFRSGSPAAAFSERDESPARARPAGGAKLSGTTSAMDHAAELRKHLGLADTASDADIAAALEAAPGAQPGVPETPLTPAADPADPPAEPVPSPEEPDEEDDPSGGAPENPEVPATSTEGKKGAKASELATLDPDAYAALKADAEAGRAARREQLEAKREALLSSAVEAGKFPPARVEHYRKLHLADAAGTEEMIANLSAGTIPVEERGTSRDPGSVGDEAEMGAIMSSFGVHS